ncbi:hypothetical protein MUP35_02265 [Patescibacteria group bacterium]|nr:hypothetical protein [Patescibacteria group bacterium]
MENIEGNSNEQKEQQLRSQLRGECEQLLIKYGKTEISSVIASSFQKIGKFLGLRQTPPEVDLRTFKTKLKIKGEAEEILISSNTKSPITSEFIKIKGEKHINELYLSKDNNAFILENWGLGESIYEKREEVELNGNTEKITTNPRQASLEEVLPYKTIVDTILQNHPIK